LRRALGRLHPDLAETLTNVVLYNSREQRPGEREGVEYCFRSRAEVEGMAERDGMLLVRVRHDLQAFDRAQLQRIFDRGSTAFWEGNPAVLDALEQAGALQQVETLRVFVSPLSRDEILALKSPECGVDLRALVTDLMRRKLFRRKKRQQGALSPTQAEDLEIRAGTAYDELQVAWKFDAVIPNHDGEDSENWEAFPCLLGDARRTVEAFAAVLQREPCDWVEQWEQDLVP
jgi:guanylate kinase